MTNFKFKLAHVHLLDLNTGTVWKFENFRQTLTGLRTNEIGVDVAVYNTCNTTIIPILLFDLRFLCDILVCTFLNIEIFNISLIYLVFNIFGFALLALVNVQFRLAN